MEKIIEELSNTYGVSKIVIRALFHIGAYEKKSLEECKILINKFYEMKVGAN